MRFALAADHEGFPLKGPIAEALVASGHEVFDLGGDGSDPTDDYTDYARAVGLAIESGSAERGVVICGSGVGVAVAASKIPGIRASVCHDTYSAHQGVEHDNMNVLCLGSLVVGSAVALELVRAFERAVFQGEERQLRRLAKLRAIEEEFAAPRGGQ